MTIYEQLGVAPVINACGIYTDLGGFRISDEIWSAMTEANASHVRMVDLLAVTGARIAELTGAESARVVPGAAAGILLSIGACMAGHQGKHWEQLPDTAGMPHEVVIQQQHRYKYDRQAWMAGATPVEIGEPGQTTVEDLAGALTADTAAILHPAHLEGHAGSLPLADVIRVAHAAGVPVVVDAAYMVHPVDVIPSLLRAGADLVCVSAKYFHGPNSGGFVAGRANLIQAVAGLDFTRYESGDYLTFGRPLKMDRSTIVGACLAYEAWQAMNHADRLREDDRRAGVILAALEDLTQITATARWFTMEEQLEVGPTNNCVVIESTGACDLVAVADALAFGHPNILCVREIDKLIFAVDALRAGEEQLIARHLRAALARI